MAEQTPMIPRYILRPLPGLPRHSHRVRFYGNKADIIEISRKCLTAAGMIDFDLISKHSTYKELYETCCLEASEYFMRNESVEIGYHVPGTHRIIKDTLYNEPPLPDANPVPDLIDRLPYDDTIYKLDVKFSSALFEFPIIMVLAKMLDYKFTFSFSPGDAYYPMSVVNETYEIENHALQTVQYTVNFEVSEGVCENRCYEPIVLNNRFDYWTSGEYLNMDIERIIQLEEKRYF